MLYFKNLAALFLEVCSHIERPIMARYFEGGPGIKATGRKSQLPEKDIRIKLEDAMSHGTFSPEVPWGYKAMNEQINRLHREVKSQMKLAK